MVKFVTKMSLSILKNAYTPNQPQNVTCFILHLSLASDDKNETWTYTLYKAYACKLSRTTQLRKADWDSEGKMTLPETP